MKKKMKIMLTALLCTGLMGGMAMEKNAEAARVALPEYQAKGDMAVIKAEKLNLATEWDKCFPKSDKVNHQKVTFVNRYGITLAADMYTPKHVTGQLPAIAVCGAFGAVKEQHSGLYAQTMAERGFLTIAFDPSYTGESGGSPRYMTSPDINTEDFSAAVDFLSVQPNVDPEKIGIIGICGWGGLGINAAAMDTRIKASAIMTIIEQGVQPGIFHYTNEGVTSWYDFTKAIHRIAGITTCDVRPLHTSEYPTAATRPLYSILDKTKIKQAYGLEIPHWEDSLRQCLSILLQQ